MNTEQLLLKKWRSLPPEKQESVMDFVLFLSATYPSKSMKNLKNNSEINTQTTTNYLQLQGKVTYYENPYEPVAMENWDVLR